MAKKTPIRNRPKNLNLFTIRLPINAVVSILHRMSGMVLFLFTPALIWSLQASLNSEASLSALGDMFQHWAFKLMLIALSWPFFHHFYAGLRHLGQDVHWMTTLNKAQFSSRIVLGLGACSMLSFAYYIW
ncbi:succinate dehydrogenase, cytochrome b556 subunit [Methylotenera mobilis]|uniref:Succinate dehydrogenase cytochrome b556 subunit n=1 Tax=Methylotenera mobilis (strain JLW8 / ATCC BAA-1282 / DSM 17540) TaxID=583345 RepID=C6WUR8_METML|nr:succinate dehydrogenase, cytochrome b556 subunit [Methylotenera mobilis]ACT47667.1 succinate dehydrogenase, cytochrome b556 subunit [Methylotenera mobilis JLW8]